MEDRAISLNDQELMENAEQLRAITNAELLKENEELKRELAHLLLRKSSVTPCDEEMAIQYTRGYIDGFKEGKATFEPKTGHWKIANSFCTCDQCGYETRPWNNTPFCPNCGARMVEPRNLKYADNDTMMPAT